MDADMQTFRGALHGLIHALDEPPTREVLSELPPLQEDLAKLFEERDQDFSRELRLPVGIDNRTSFLLGILRFIEDTPENKQHGRVIALVGIPGTYAEMLARFRRRILVPFVDEIRGRLLDRLPQTPNSSGGVFIGGDSHGSVFSHTGDVVSGSPGAMAAQGGSRIRDSSIVYQPRTDHGRTFMQWANELDDVPSDRRDAVRNALEVAARAADGEALRGSEVAHAIETIDEASPTLRSRIRSFAHTVTVHAAAVGVVHGAAQLAPLLANALRLVFPDLPASP